MRLEMLAKDESSGRTGCPSVFVDIDENGQTVIWGQTVDAATAATIPNHLPGEGGVRMSFDVLAAAVDAYRAR